VLGACICVGIASRLDVRSSFAQKYSFSVMACTGVLSSEVGLGGFGWVLRLFLSLVLGHVLECLGLFLLRRLGGGLFGNVVDSFVIALVLSGGGASLRSGLLDVIVGVGSVVSRCVLGLSDSGLS
jgi:hypothetical protein